MNEWMKHKTTDKTEHWATWKVFWNKYKELHDPILVTIIDIDQLLQNKNHILLKQK